MAMECDHGLRKCEGEHVNRTCCGEKAHRATVDPAFVHKLEHPRSDGECTDRAHHSDSDHEQDESA